LWRFFCKFINIYLVAVLQVSLKRMWKTKVVTLSKAQEVEEEALAETRWRHGSWLWFKSKTLEWNKKQGY